MNENEIRTRVANLFTALQTSNEAAVLNAGIALVTGVIVDLNRIANALEKLAGPPNTSGWPRG